VTDELDRIRDLRPSVAPPSQQLVETERTCLMTVIDRETQHEAPNPTRARKRWVLPGAAIVALATAAAGYAITRDVGTTTEVSCPDGIVDAVTGNPVEDCADLWRRQNGTEPPELVAYDNQRGSISVVPVDAEVPVDWTPLEQGFSQDAGLIELDAALADYGDGLNAQCYSPEDARPIAESTLERLGLHDWSVHIDEDRPGGDGTCTTHVLDPEEKQVVIFPLEGAGPPNDASYRVLAASAQAQVDDQCLSREDAVETVRQIAADLDIDESAGEVTIHSVPDPSATCSRTDVNVGGSIEITVRGA